MNIGKKIRMNRLFSHPSGKFMSVAVDHFIGYQDGLPSGLREIEKTLAEVVRGRPDALTMHKGILKSCWTPHAGTIPVILQSMVARVDDSACEYLSLPEDAVRMGADAFAVAIFVRGKTEAQHLRLLADMVRQVEKYELPLICHIYPRTFALSTPEVSFLPEDIEWAVRCGLEAGADIIKVPYCGDIEAYHQIIDRTPIPVVAAGGPKTADIQSALQMIADVMVSGAKGATIGRNIWGFEPISTAIQAFKQVIHMNVPPAEINFMGLDQKR